MTFFREEKVELLMALRGQGISNLHILEAMEMVPRERFVPDELVDYAWRNTPLPIECGQTISQPLVVALMTERLAITDRMRVLEIGTGSGYQTAILSRLARRVFSIERHEVLLKTARRRFRELRIDNVTTRLADGMAGWKQLAPFERIMVTAAAERVPENLVDQLTPDGRMVIPVGASIWDQKLYVVRRDEGGGFSQEPFLDVRFVPLVEGVA